MMSDVFPHKFDYIFVEKLHKIMRQTRLSKRRLRARSVVENGRGAPQHGPSIKYTSRTGSWKRWGARGAPLHGPSNKYTSRTVRVA